MENTGYHVLWEKFEIDYKMSFSTFVLFSTYIVYSVLIAVIKWP